MFRIACSLMLLAATTSVVGCSENTREPGSEENPPAAGAGAGAGEMGHEHDEGPHGGAIADWGGGEYHVEFTVDHEKQEATIYVLDANAQSPAPVPAESLLLTISDPSFQVELQPVPLEGEAEGTSSRFVGQHEKLGVVQEFAGTISGAVAGTPYAGDFEEHAHDH